MRSGTRAPIRFGNMCSPGGDRKADKNETV